MRLGSRASLRRLCLCASFAGVSHCIVLGDVTYGACCVDDLSAAALGAQFLVHYGHSCLVPVDVTTLPCMYVFVDIRFDCAHLLACVRDNFASASRLSLAGTIQFATALHSARAALAAEYPSLSVPQARAGRRSLLRVPSLSRAASASRCRQARCWAAPRPWCPRARTPSCSWRTAGSIWRQL